MFSRTEHVRQGRSPPSSVQARTTAALVAAFADHPVRGMRRRPQHVVGAATTLMNDVPGTLIIRLG